MTSCKILIRLCCCPSQIPSFGVSHCLRCLVLHSANNVVNAFFRFKPYYYTSDSLWKIWLVESIQSIHNSLWTWHGKCNICCRYCIYHVTFNVCLVTKPLGAKQNGWTLRFCFWGWIMWKMYNKTIIEFGFRMISWIIKTEVCVTCPSLRLRQITQTLVLIIHVIIWLCLIRTGNYQIQEFDWLNRILTAV